MYASISVGEYPHAYILATNAPAEVPTTKSMGMCRSSSAFNTPTCATPAAPPPLKTNPIFCCASHSEGRMKKNVKIKTQKLRKFVLLYKVRPYNEKMEKKSMGNKEELKITLKCLFGFEQTISTPAVPFPFLLKLISSTLNPRKTCIVNP